MVSGSASRAPDADDGSSDKLPEEVCVVEPVLIEPFPPTASPQKSASSSLRSHSSARSPSPSPPPMDGAPLGGRAIYRYRGLLYLLLAQLFASLNLVSSRYLSTSLPDGRKFHALEVLVVRMGITMICCGVWMWWKRVPYAPLGPPGLRLLLLVRGMFGFVGVFSVYYAVSYLPLSDATVISFLVPTCVGILCSIVPSLKEPITPAEILGGIVSLVGVMLIARPSFVVRLFPGLDDSAPSSNVVTSSASKTPNVSPAQRALAVSVALFGVLGMASALTLVRVLGKRIHPLISVMYFSTVVTVVSFIGLVTIPSVGGFVVPHGAMEWCLLVAVGFLGFAMQFLLTKGVQLEKGGRAGSSMYSQMVFSIIWEWAIWNNIPSGWSVVGGGMILTSAIVVGVMKDHRMSVKAGDEERPLLGQPARASERED